MKRYRDIIRNYVILFPSIMMILYCQGCSGPGNRSFIISCNEENDLYRVLKENKINCEKYNTPLEAVSKATEGAGVLILADGYPDKTTLINSSLIKEAGRKKLRLYIEYPSWLPGLQTGQPESTVLERVVVTTGSIENLPAMQILSIHGCNYVPVSADDPLLSVSKVAGFDKAVYGLNKDSQAILFNDPSGNLLISTTKLSQFVTARYSPKESMQAIWSYILKWVSGSENEIKTIVWKSTVRPSFEPGQELPEDAARIAVQRGIDWHTNAKMVLNEGGWQEYKKLWNLNDSNMHTTVPAVNNAAPGPYSDAGDGTFGVLEGITSEVRLDGSQPTRWWLRSDSNGESSLAFALRSMMDGDQGSRLIAGNLLDWLYFKMGVGI